MANQDKQQKSKKVTFKALEGAATDTVRRFGSAVKEHLVAFTGKDHENDTTTKRSLQSIANSKVNEEYRDQNIKQQAGFSAEIKAATRENAEHAIHDTGRRSTRTDDMSQQSAENGNAIGGTNDQLYDLAEIDSNGIYIAGTGRQVKFVGGSPNECADLLLQKKFDKYRDADVEIEVPKDFYEGVQAKLVEKADKLSDQIKKAEERGDSETAIKKKSQLERIEKTMKNLKASSVTNEEAIEARLHPLLSTAKDVGKVAHRSGVEQAKMGAVISGSASIVRNLVACAKEEIAPKDAAIEVLKDTGTGAAFSYATAFSGAIAKGVMQNSSSTYIQGLSRTNLASGLVSTTIDVGKTMTRYIKGELTGAQCIEELGERGFGQIGSAMYTSLAVLAVKGTESIAVKVVAGMAGSTLGYAAATAVYKELSTALKEYELAVEDRQRIEAECAEAVKLICQYRAEMKVAVETYMLEHLETFVEGFSAMDKAILENDVNGFIVGNVAIQKYLGHEVQFRTQKEFDDLMMSDNNLKL